MNVCVSFTSPASLTTACANSPQSITVFRREPLWQVSMNVRLHPLVRCSFDKEAHVLRLILREPIEKADVPAEQWPQELVIYVLKVRWQFTRSTLASVFNYHLCGSAGSGTQGKLPVVCGCPVGELTT
jgi:hypothetical protein